MRPVFIKLTNRANEPLLVNLDLVATCKVYGEGSSKIILTTGDELFVQESVEELEALLNE